MSNWFELGAKLLSNPLFHASETFFCSSCVEWCVQRDALHHITTVYWNPPLAGKRMLQWSRKEMEEIAVPPREHY